MITMVQEEYYRIGRAIAGMKCTSLPAEIIKELRSTTRDDLKHRRGLLKRRLRITLPPDLNAKVAMLAENGYSAAEVINSALISYVGEMDV